MSTLGMEAAIVKNKTHVEGRNCELRFAESGMGEKRFLRVRQDRTVREFLLECRIDSL